MNRSRHQIKAAEFAGGHWQTVPRKSNPSQNSGQIEPCRD
jgi:hypothetical protein